MTTIAQALAAAITQLTPGDSPRLDAEVLLACALDKPRSHLHAWPDRELEPAAAARFAALVARRAAGEPVAYLTGRREFWSLDLAVSPATLIPRPETETLVELALARLPASRAGRVADLGTGSGAIALAIALERPACFVTGLDRSAAALAVARANARRLGIANIGFVAGDWCAPLAPARLDLITCNPPYVAEDDPHLRAGDVRFEPLTALASGPLGLDDIRRLAPMAFDCLAAGGWLLLEHGWEQGPAVASLLTALGFRSVVTHPDSAGRARVTLGRHP